MSRDLETLECGGCAPPVLATRRDDSHLFDNVIVQPRPDTYLRISRQTNELGCAALYVGSCSSTDRVLSVPFQLDAARITNAPRPDLALWLGNAAFELPWFELLKAADFLVLPIPVPYPDATAVAP